MTMLIPKKGESEEAFKARHAKAMEELGYEKSGGWGSKETKPKENDGKTQES